MRTKLISVVTLCSLVALATPAWPQSADVEGSKGQKKEETKTLEEKKSIEKRKSQSKRKGTSDTSGKDKTKSQAVRDVRQAMNQQSVDLSRSLDVIFLQNIQEWERNGREPFKRCRITTRPSLPADFGLTAQLDANTIDTIMASWLQQAAASNAPLPADAQLGILAYRDCIAQYGAIIAEAYLVLNEHLKDVKAQVKPTQKDGLLVRDLSLQDFELLAADALQEAVNHVETGDFLDPQIQRTYANLLGAQSCTWNGTVEQIRCGAAHITLSASPQLVFANIPIYGQGGYYGFRAEYKLSNNYSLSQAMEDLAQSSEFNKWAKEVSNFAEDLEAKGQLKDAVLARRNAWETMQNGKVGVGISHLLPSVHQ